MEPRSKRIRGDRPPDRNARRRALHAPNLRDRESRCFAIYELSGEFVRFVDEEVLPLVDLPGYKRTEKQIILRHATHNLILTGLAGRVVADGRNCRDKGVRLRVGVWDALVKAGFAELHRGSELSGKTTRYAATKKLLILRHQWELQMLEGIELFRNSELSSPTHRALVYLHTGKVDLFTGDPLPDEEKRKPVSFLDHLAKVAQPGPDGKADPRAIQNGLDYFKAKEDTIESINANNLTHGWAATCTHPDGTTTTFQPNVCLRQIHVGGFFQAARLYSFGELSGQNLPKEVRRTMLIDGEKVAELDYSGMHPRMLYHRERCNPSGDIYQPELVLPGCATAPGVRGLIKQATNICLNCRSRRAAHSSINKKLLDHGDLGRMMLQEAGGVIGLVKRLEEAHATIFMHFFTGVGMELMTEDGKIMMAVMRAFRDAGKPALPIHDSVVCRVSDARFARATMVETYRQGQRYTPEIHRKF